MGQLADTIELGPKDEALRLWSAAREAQQAASDDLVKLFESLDLGLHAAEILTIHLLQPVKDGFPATIALQLNLPDPQVDPHRDGINVPKVLQFTDVIDLLSGEELECVSPGMHRGWEDRRFSCRRSRVAAQEAVGITLAAADQEQLLLLSAYRNRVFRCPPPVRVEPARIRTAFESLGRLVEGLVEAAG
jgi:hypothetical protein